MKHRIVLGIFMLLACAAFTETLYFRSDWVGLEMEPITRVRMDEFEFVLGVVRTDAKTVKTLFRKQKEWKRWETAYNERHERTNEYEFENNILTSEYVYDRKNRVKSEKRYAKGALSERLAYSYSARGIDFVETFDAHDSLLYTDEYALAPSGRLRSMRRVFPDGSIAVVRFTYGERTLVSDWEYKDGRIIETAYNERGQARHREEWDKDALLAVKDFEYDAQTHNLAREIEKNIDDNTRLERVYDAEGNIAKELEGTGDRPPVEFSYVYDGGKRTVTRKKSDIGVEEWRFAYDGEGNIAREEYYRRGFLQMRTVYTADNTWYEEIFHEDEPIIRAYFVKEKKIREEFLQEGRVVRTKEY
jgi:hypothetical protein